MKPKKFLLKFPTQKYFEINLKNFNPPKNHSIISITWNPVYPRGGGGESGKGIWVKGDIHL